MSFLVNDDEFLPWALTVDDLGLSDITGQGDDNGSIDLPTICQAAGYMSRFCTAYGLANQSHAALAAALTLPIHRSFNLQQSVIRLPRLHLPTLVAHPTLDCSYPPILLFSTTK